MLVNCAYYGDHAFLGLEIIHDEGNFDINPPDYCDFIVDVLNRNFRRMLGYEKYLSEKYEWNLAEFAKEKALYDIDSPGYYIYNYFEKSKHFQDGVLRHIEITKSDIEQLGIEKYKKIADAVFAANNFPKLTPSQRFSAYVGANTEPGGVVASSISIYWSPIVNDKDISIDETMNNDHAIRDISLLNISSDEKYDRICRQIEKSKIKYGVNYHYQFPTIRDAFTFLFFEAIKNNRKIKKCGLCDKYFIAERSSSKYCSSPSPQNPSKTCQEYVRYQKYLDTTHETAARLYKQVYNQMANAYRRTQKTGGNIMLREKLDNFMRMSVQLKQEVKNGTKTEAEYIEWLQGIKNTSNSRNQGVKDGDSKSEL